MTKNDVKTYSELCKLKSFLERFEYLQMFGILGEETFGYNRYLNQSFYKSRQWKNARDFVIVRDCGCDLGVEGRDIYGQIYIHHMNPITIDDIKTNSEILIDPEFLITTKHTTHNAIHYGDKSLLVLEPIERRPNDTSPWLIKEK